MKKKTGFRLAVRIFAQRLCEQAQETLKKVFCGICLRNQHDNAYMQTKRFKALDGITAVLKERSKLLVRANNSRPAFTLAETLIALTVIGVIAAITVPTLIQRTNKQEYVSKLQKTYSTLSQTANMIIAENGSPKGDDSWLTESNVAASVYDMFKKYLNNAKDCRNRIKDCFPIELYGDRANPDKNMEEGISRYRRALILADGVVLNFTEATRKCNYTWNNGSTDVCAFISADINGPQKPNKSGRDIFDFVLKENGLYPLGCDENRCDTAAPNASCTCKVLREGAMNY